MPSIGSPRALTTRPRRPVADRDLHDAAGGLYQVALFDLLKVAEEDAPDVVLFEVVGEAEDAVGELDHFSHHRIPQAVDAGDAVSDLEDAAHAGHFRLGAELLDLFAENRAYFVWTDSHNVTFSGSGSRLSASGPCSE